MSYRGFLASTGHQHTEVLDHPLDGVMWLLAPGALGRRALLPVGPQRFRLNLAS